MAVALLAILAVVAICGVAGYLSGRGRSGVAIGVNKEPCANCQSIVGHIVDRLSDAVDYRIADTATNAVAEDGTLEQRSGRLTG